MTEGPSYRDLLQAAYDFHHRDLPPPDLRWGAPEAAVRRKLSKLVEHGLLERGVSLRTSHLTPAGERVMKGEAELPWRQSFSKRRK